MKTEIFLKADHLANRFRRGRQKNPIRNTIFEYAGPALSGSGIIVLEEGKHAALGEAFVVTSALLLVFAIADTYRKGRQ